MWKYLAIRRTPILALTCHPKTDFSWKNHAPYNRITTVYGRDVVHIDSYHELLQAVFKKPIHQTQKRLQRMRMALQNYSPDIRYKKGRLMFIADALSRSYRLTTDNAQHDSSEMHALREVHHTDGLSVSPKRLEEFKLRTVQDPEMQLLTSQTQKGWPSSRKVFGNQRFALFSGW